MKQRTERRGGGWRGNASIWVVVVALASCQDRAEPAPTPEMAPAAGYPSLYTVPPRPRLSYPVEQRRTIVEGLVADRENARYTSQAIRYRAGLRSMPPPEPRIVAAAPATPEPDQAANPAPPSEPPANRPAPELLYEDDDLDSFMRELVDRPPRPAPPEGPEARLAPGSSAVPGPGREGTQVVPAAMTAPRPDPAGDDPALAEAAGRSQVALPPAPTKPAHGAKGAEPIAPERGETAAPAPVPKPAPMVAQVEVADGLVGIDLPAEEALGTAVGTVAFEPGSAALPAHAQAYLSEMLDAVKAQGMRVTIVGEAPAPALALDRARAVGLALVRGGLPADRLEMTLAHDAAGDRARLFLAMP